MDSPILKGTSTWDWAVIDLILVSLFAAIITINLFTLGRRLQRLEKRNVLDLERGRCDIDLVNEFRSLRETYPQKPFDEKAFECFMDLDSGTHPTIRTFDSDHNFTSKHDQLMQFLVKFFRLDVSKKEHEQEHEPTGLEPQSGYADRPLQFPAEICICDSASADFEASASRDSAFESPTSSDSFKTHVNLLECSKHNNDERLGACDEVARRTTDRQDSDAPTPGN